MSLYLSLRIWFKIAIRGIVGIFGNDTTKRKLVSVDVLNVVQILESLLALNLDLFLPVLLSINAEIKI